MRITMDDLKLLNYYVGTGNFENKIWLFGNEEGCGSYIYEDNINVRINEVKRNNYKPSYLKELPKMRYISSKFKDPSGAFVDVLRKLTPTEGEVPTLDLRPLMRVDQKIPHCDIEEYKDIIPDKAASNLFTGAFYNKSTKNNPYMTIAKERIEILKNFTLENKPKIIFVAGEQEEKKKLLLDLLDENSLELDNFNIESSERKHKLTELPKTSIHKAKDYEGYFVFIYHPGYINYGLGKEKYPIGKIGPLEIYRQIMQQLLIH